MVDPHRDRAAGLAMLVVVAHLQLAWSPRALAAPDEGNPPAAKALRDAEEVFRSTADAARFEEWERRLREALAEMETGITEGRADALVREHLRRLAEGETAERRYLYGRLLGKLDRLEEARDQFERALRLDSTYYLANEGLAVYHMKRGRPNEAIRELERALATNPRFDGGRFTLGGILFGGQEYDRAIAELLEIGKESESYYPARLLIGQCRLARKELELAIAEFRAAQALRPEAVEPSYYLADAQRRIGDLDGSIATCEAVLARKPDEYFGAFLAGRAYFEKGQLDKARSALQTVLDKAPPTSGIDREKVKALIAEIDSNGRSDASPSDRMSLRDLLEQVEKDPDPRVRRRAIRLLAALDAPDLLPTFARALLDADFGVRVIAVREMGRFGGKDALPLVRRLLREDPDRLVRGAACGAIAAIGDPGGAASLVESLRDPDPYVVDEALRALAALTGRHFTPVTAIEWSAEERARFVAQAEAWWAEESKR